MSSAAFNAWMTKWSSCDMHVWQNDHHKTRVFGKMASHSDHFYVFSLVNVHDVNCMAKFKKWHAHVSHTPWLKLIENKMATSLFGPTELLLKITRDKKPKKNRLTALGGLQHFCIPFSKSRSSFPSYSNTIVWIWPEVPQGCVMGPHCDWCWVKDPA